MKWEEWDCDWIVGYGHSSSRNVSTGPLIIGDKARGKFLKIQAICSDKISNFFPKMFRPDQASGLQK